MATRRTPFRGATTALAFQSLLGEPPDSIRKWNVTVPRELERIILRLLQKERSRRLPDAYAVRDAMAKLSARNGGEWLRRLPAAVVPLVAAADPVARHPRASVSRARHLAVDEDAAQNPPSSSQHPVVTEPADPHGVLRPRRLPQQERLPWQNAVAQETKTTSGTTSPAQVAGPAILSAEPPGSEQTPQAAAATLEHAAVESSRPASGLGIISRQDERALAGTPLAAFPAPLPVITDPSFRPPQRAKSSPRLAVAAATQSTRGHPVSKPARSSSPKRPPMCDRPQAEPVGRWL